MYFITPFPRRLIWSYICRQRHTHCVREQTRDRRHSKLKNSDIMRVPGIALMCCCCCTHAAIGLDTLIEHIHHDHAQDDIPVHHHSGPVTPGSINMNFIV